MSEWNVGDLQNARSQVEDAEGAAENPLARALNRKVQEEIDKAIEEAGQEEMNDVDNSDEDGPDEE